MSASGRKLLALISEISGDSGGNLSLAALARRAGWSTFYLQRQLRRFAHESPKQLSLRIRLDRAAVELRTSDASILDIALGAGFTSHEVFSRAFRRQFGRTPRDFRAQARVPAAHRLRYRRVVHAVSPCVHLYGISLSAKQERITMPVSEIERRVLPNEQPILFIQRRIPRTELQQTMGECFGALYGYGQQAGLAIAGFPIARYVSAGAGLWTVDLIVPLAAPAETNGEMQSGVLVSGPVAFAVHHGPYDQLPETNAAIEKWIEDKGYRVGGAPWEQYVTDPGETPDPADWRTEVFWPLEA